MCESHSSISRRKCRSEMYGAFRCYLFPIVVVVTVADAGTLFGRCAMQKLIFRSTLNGNENFAAPATTTNRSNARLCAQSQSGASGGSSVVRCAKLVAM